MQGDPKSLPWRVFSQSRSPSANILEIVVAIGRSVLWLLGYVVGEIACRAGIVKSHLPTASTVAPTLLIVVATASTSVRTTSSSGVAAAVVA